MSGTPSGSQAQPTSSQLDAPSVNSPDSSTSDTASKQYREALDLLNFLSNDVRAKVNISSLSYEEKGGLRDIISAAVLEVRKVLGSFDGKDFVSRSSEKREKILVSLKELISMYLEHIESRNMQVLVDLIPPPIQGPEYIEHKSPDVVVVDPIPIPGPEDFKKMLETEKEQEEESKKCAAMADLVVRQVQALHDAGMWIQEVPGKGPKVETKSEKTEVGIKETEVEIDSEDTEVSNVTYRDPQHPKPKMPSSTGGQDRAAESPSPTDSEEAQQGYEQILKLLGIWQTGLHNTIGATPIEEQKKNCLLADIQAVVDETHTKLGPGDGSAYKNMNVEEQLKLVRGLMATWTKTGGDVQNAMHDIIKKWKKKGSDLRQKVKTMTEELKKEEADKGEKLKRKTERLKKREADKREIMKGKIEEFEKKEVYDREEMARKVQSPFDQLRLSSEEVREDNEEEQSGRNGNGNAVLSMMQAIEDAGYRLKDFI